MLIQELFESKSAPLYHGTTLSGAMGIVKSNFLKPYYQMYDQNEMPTGVLYASMSRDIGVAARHLRSKFTRDLSAGNRATGVIFELDQEKLSRALGKKLRPFDDFGFHTKGTSRSQNKSEFEEIAIGGIKNFNSFIKQIFIFCDPQDIDQYAALTKFPHQVLDPMVVKGP